MKKISLMLIAISALFLIGCSDQKPPAQEWVKVAPSNVTFTDAPLSVERRLRTSDRGTQADRQAELIALINRTRAEHRLHALSVDQNLNRAAQAYAKIVSGTRDIQHVEADGTTPGRRASEAGYDWSFIAENLASGQDSPAETVKDWLKSPRHRKALLHKEPVDIGVGYVRDPNDPFYKEYWVMLVATPL